MSTIPVTTEVSKETYELAKGLIGFVGAMKDKLTDGVGVDDLPAALSAFITHIPPALDGADSVMDELKANPAAFIAAWLTAGLDLYEILTKDDAA